MKFTLITSLFLLSYNLTFTQLIKTDIELTTITNASEGDLYQGSDDNRFYIGLSNGSVTILKMILHSFL